MQQLDDADLKAAAGGGKGVLGPLNLIHSIGPATEWFEVATRPGYFTRVRRILSTYANTGNFQNGRWERQLRWPSGHLEDWE
jgi:hypothetical protein